MKKILSIALALGLIAAACDKYDHSAMEDTVASLEKRVEALESLNDEVEALKAIVEGKLMVASCVEAEGLYTITLSDGTVLKVNSATAGYPAVAVIVENGRNYWGYYKDGKVEPLMYAGKKVEVTSLTPAIRVNKDNMLEISVDGGRTWTESDTPLSGGLFSKVEQLDDCILLTMADGFTEFRVPFVDDSQMQFFSFSGKQFFTDGQKKEIPMEMVGVETYTITEKPEGWKASLAEGVLTVTAPAKNEGETSGIIKMLGIGDEPVIAQLYVAVGTAPCLITISDDKMVKIKPNPQSCFYGAALLDEFDPKTIAKDISAITSPMMSRYPFTGASEANMPLSDLVGEVVLGETYVVWALPYTGYACTEADVLYEAVTSIGVTSEITDVTFEDAKITVSVKGTDTYYLVPLETEMTLDAVITDLNGNYANSYDRYKHTSSFRGLLSSVVEAPMAGLEYELLVLPVKGGAWRKADAVTFKVKLNDYVLGGDITVSLEAGVAQYKTIPVDVTAGAGAYKVFVSVVADADYTAGGYSSDAALTDYLKTLSPSEYSAPYIYNAQNLESGSKYWIVAAAIDRNGFMGSPARLEVNTKTVEYSTAVLTVGEVAATLNSAVIPVTSSGEVVSYRYMCMSASAGGYWYNSFIDNDQAAYDALIYRTVECTDVTAETAAAGISFSDLEFGTGYIFRVIGYDKDGKITNMGKADFSPSVGKVVASTDERWIDAKPSVSAQFSGNSIRLNVAFPMGCESFVMTRMSSEEYTAQMPGSARLKTDYVVGHYNVETFTSDLVNYTPDWYISADKPYILIAWKDENGWYEPLVYDSATGTILNK